MVKSLCYKRVESFRLHCLTLRRFELFYNTATTNLYQRQIIFLIKKSLIQFQTEDNNLGTLVVVVQTKTIRYMNTRLSYIKILTVLKKLDKRVY